MRKIHNLENKKDFRRKLRKLSTPHEVILWSRLRRSQLGHKFRRQHSIDKYIVDFYCPKKKLIIELDVSQHIDKQKEHDEQRDKYLENLGFTILRFWDNDVNNNLEGVLMKIIEKIKNNTSSDPSSTEEGRIFNRKHNISPFSIFISFFIISYMIFTSFAHAADAYILENPLINGQTSVSGPAEYIRIFFIFGLGLVGITALFAIVFGGIRYSLSGSSETGKAEGKRWIIGAFTGIILLFSSYLILNTINPDLVSLKNPNLAVIYIPKTVDNYIPTEVGYQKPVIENISSSLQNLSQHQGQLNSSNTQVIIDKSDHALYIYRDGQLIGQTPIGIGINDKTGSQAGGVSGDKITPVGNFTITNDIRYSPNGVYSGQFGSNMGPAFLGLSCADQNGNYRGIGIHGSANDTLGSTFGCIRVKNADVILIYQNLKAGTRVQIRN